MVDWHCWKGLPAWSEAANDGNISKEKIVSLAAELIETAATDGLAVQVLFACSDLVEEVGYAFLPYSA